MHFIDCERSPKRVTSVARGQPGCVVELVARLINLGRGSRGALAGRGKWVAFDNHRALGGMNLELVVRTRVQIWDENLPDPRAAEHPHHVEPAIPTIEVT